MKVITDNDNAARIVLVGSRKPHLQALAIDIFQLCLAKRIVLDAQWIPRSVNERADLLSRFVDKDDWSLNPVVFQDIDVKWGPHTVNRFASYYNAQLPRFNSEFASPGSCGVDAFAQDWSCEINWICPPVSLIVRSVRKLEACNGFGTLRLYPNGRQRPSGLFCIPLLLNLRALLKMFLFYLGLTIYSLRVRDK